MNGVGLGKIKRMYPGLGIGTITPDSGGPEIVFTDGIVAGGRKGFDDLREGDAVKYHKYSEKIGDADFAEYVFLKKAP